MFEQSNTGRTKARREPCKRERTKIRVLFPCISHSIWPKIVVHYLILNKGVRQHQTLVLLTFAAQLKSNQNVWECYQHIMILSFSTGIPSSSEPLCVSTCSAYIFNEISMACTFSPHCCPHFFHSTVWLPIYTMIVTIILFLFSLLLSFQYTHHTPAIYTCAFEPVGI